MLDAANVCILTLTDARAARALTKQYSRHTIRDAFIVTRTKKKYKKD